MDYKINNKPSQWVAIASFPDREAKIKAICYALESAVDALSDYQRVDMYDKDLENAKEVLGVVK